MKDEDRPYKNYMKIRNMEKKIKKLEIENKELKEKIDKIYG